MDEKITRDEILKRVLEAINYEILEDKTYTAHLRNKKFHEFD